MNNTKFATCIHILTLLAKHKDEYLSSEFIAGSVNVHPVIIRKTLADLRRHKLIESKEGKTGGSRLALSSKKIYLSEIYSLAHENSVMGKSNEPNPECPVGKNINKHLAVLYGEVDKKIIKHLGRETLYAFAEKFK